jgi:uncharacterized surface protein with fasciclin (FAS1) repeats
MKTIKWYSILLLCGLFLAAACNAPTSESTSAAATSTPSVGQSGVKDDDSQKDVVKVAVGSPDHTTLVKALQAAGLVDALANAGPFTVFAPTNAAFDKLPKGTLDDLLKPANKSKLADILQHHVTLSALDAAVLQDGQSLGMVDGTNATISKKDGTTYIGDAKIVASVRASNGFVHVVDGVVLPPTK